MPRELPRLAECQVSKCLERTCANPSDLTSDERLKKRTRQMLGIEARAMADGLGSDDSQTRVVRCHKPSGTLEPKRRNSILVAMAPRVPDRAAEE